jgi:hypothetical protein
MQILKYWQCECRYKEIRSVDFSHALYYSVSDDFSHALYYNISDVTEP